MKRFLRVLACAAAALAVLLLGSTTAQAGTYAFDQRTSADMRGWFLNPEPGYFGCSRESRPGPCADGDVPNPTPLRLFMKGSVAADSQAVWRWNAPEGVTLVSGSLDVAYAVTTDTRVFMRTWLKSEAVSSQPKLYLRSSDGSGTWTIPGGQEGVAVYLEALAAHSFTDKWQNTLRLDRFSGVLRDDTAPVVQVGGPLADGTWQSSPQPVCLDVSAADPGSGVKTAELVGPLGAVLATDTAPAGTALQPGDLDYAPASASRPPRWATESASSPSG